jgi:hypothetical protein
VRRSAWSGAEASRTLIAFTLVAALAAPAVSSAQDGRVSGATSSLAGTTSPDAAVVKLPEPPQSAPVRGNATIDRDGGGYVAAALLGLFLVAVAPRRYQRTALRITRTISSSGEPLTT